MSTEYNILTNEYTHPIPIGSIVLSNFTLSPKVSQHIVSIDETVNKPVLILEKCVSPEPLRCHWYKVLFENKVFYLTFSHEDNFYARSEFRIIRYIHKTT